MKVDRAGQMEAFVRSVQLGGFSRAASELGVTPSALSKLVSRLEDRLSVRLFNRSTRKLSLTPEGQDFYAKCIGILEQMEETEAEIRGLRDRPRGKLRMRTFSGFGLHQLSSALPLFFELYPEVQLDLDVSDHITVMNFVEDEVDLYIGLTPLTGSLLHARKIIDVERSVCAAPSYLKKYGTPCSPEELTHHNCICVYNMPELRRWPFDTGQETRFADVTGNVTTNSGNVAVQLALRGMGVVYLSNMLVGKYIQRGSLVPLLTPEYRAKPASISAVYAHGKHKSPKVEAMVNFLCRQLSGESLEALTA